MYGTNESDEPIASQEANDRQTVQMAALLLASPVYVVGIGWQIAVAIVRSVPEVCRNTSLRGLRHSLADVLDDGCAIDD